MNITEQLQINLKKYREAAHLNGSELARRSSVSRSYIWQIEQGESVPTTDIVQQLAAGLDITVETLLGLDGKMPIAYQLCIVCERHVGQNNIAPDIRPGEEVICRECDEITPDREQAVKHFWLRQRLKSQKRQTSAIGSFR